MPSVPHHENKHHRFVGEFAKLLSCEKPLSEVGMNIVSLWKWLVEEDTGLSIRHPSGPSQQKNFIFRAISWDY